MEKVCELCKLDGYWWYCERARCMKTKSARVGTWFEKSKLILKQALTFMYCKNKRDIQGNVRLGTRVKDNHSSVD
jgi:hypothetical protein